jgi:hypothetical protein
MPANPGEGGRGGASLQSPVGVANVRLLGHAFWPEAEPRQALSQQKSPDLAARAFLKIGPEA